MAKVTKWVCLRKRTTWVLLILLVPSFILFFHATGQSPFGQSSDVAGTLFGRKIPWERFERQRTWVRAKLREDIRELPAEILDPLIEQEAWRELLLVEEARREKRRVSDVELAAFLRTVPAFQREGRFDPERYRLLLRAQGLTPSAFEELVRGDLAMDQLVNAVKASVSVTEEEVTAAYERAHERLQATLISFETAAYTTQAAAAVTEDALRAHYDAHPAEARLPEQISFEYLGRTREELRAQLKESEEELRAFYDQHQAEFATEDGTPVEFEAAREQVQARLTEAAARTRLTALALDLEEDTKASLRFEEIALKRSLSPHMVGPIPSGNPWVPGGPEPALFEAVKALAEGRMSDVIETGLGVYLARVTQRLPASVKPFEEAREAVRDRLIQERAGAAAREAAETLKAKLTTLRAAGWRLEEALFVDGVPTRTVSFTRDEVVEGVGEAPDVNRAAFETPLGDLTGVLETPSGFVLLRPEERIPADAGQSAQEETALRERTLTDKQTAHLSQWLADLRAQAKLQTFTPPQQVGAGFTDTP